MSNEVVTLDLVSRASEICIGGYCGVKGDFVALRDLHDEDISKFLRRRIIAVHEGTHNGIEFRGNEIRKMVKAAQELKEQEGRKYFKVPIILDHSPYFLDKVGATYELKVGKHPDDGKIAAIADVEFWNTAPILQEVAERVRLDPENTYFSVRVRGKIGEDKTGEPYLYDMILVHIAVVNEPADQGAKMISELSAIPAHETPKADENYSWDAAAAIRRLRIWAGGPDKEDIDWAKYRKGFAWYDSENPKSFGSYKLPHHDVVNGRIVVIWNGVRAAMAALKGARGGVDIPDSDKRGVYNHLKRHYRQFDKEAPDFSTIMGDNSDFPLNRGNVEEEIKTSSKGDIMDKDIETIKADLQAECEKMLAEREAELQEEFDKKLKEQEELAELRAEIIAIDADVDKDLLRSFNKEQLEKFKKDLERRATIVETTAKSIEGQDGNISPEDLATKYYGAIEPVSEEVD
jgi:hypothetical protein